MKSKIEEIASSHFEQRERKLEELDVEIFILKRLFKSQDSAMELIIEKIEMFNIGATAHKHFKGFSLSLDKYNDKMRFSWEGKVSKKDIMSDLNLRERANIYHDINSFLEIVIDRLKEEIDYACKTIEESNGTV